MTDTSNITLNQFTDSLFKAFAKRSLNLAFIYMEDFYHEDYEKNISRWIDRYILNILEEVFEYKTAVGAEETTKEALDVVSYMISLYGYTVIQIYKLSNKDNNLNLLFDNNFKTSAMYTFFDERYFESLSFSLMDIRRMFPSRKYHKTYIPNMEETLKSLVKTQHFLARTIKLLFSIVTNSVAPSGLEKIINQYFRNIDLQKYQEIESSDFGKNREQFIGTVESHYDSIDAKFIKTWMIPR